MCFNFAATPRANHMVLVFLEIRLVLEQDQAPESLIEFSQLKSSIVSSTYCL